MFPQMRKQSGESANPGRRMGLPPPELRNTAAEATAAGLTYLNCTQ